LLILFICPAHSHPLAEPTTDAIDVFIQRWEKSGGHERGAGHQFLLEFCELLGLGKADPPVADNALNAYTFERRVDRRKPDGTTTPNWIDLYKSGSFVMETQQGVNRLRAKENLIKNQQSTIKNQHSSIGNQKWSRQIQGDKRTPLPATSKLG